MTASEEELLTAFFVLINKRYKSISNSSGGAASNIQAEKKNTVWKLIAEKYNVPSREGDIWSIPAY